MAGRNDSAQAYRVARYYYIDNLSQADIARLEQISRSTVSRLLDKARASGMVTIDIQMPLNPVIERLETELKDRLNVKRITVIPASVNECTDATDETIIADLASVAAPVVREMLEGRSVVGLGWGRTLYQTVGFMPFGDPDPSMLFVPLVSNFSMRNRFLQTSTIVSLYGERFGASTYYLNISGVNAPGEKRTESEKLNINQLDEYWKKMSAAVISLGSPPLKRNPYFIGEGEMRMLTDAETDKDACGEILSQIFFEDGHTNIMLGKKSGVVAFPVERLSSVPEVICIAGGVNKAVPIITAARNRYFTTLITDHLTAGEMLAYLENEGN